MDGDTAAYNINIYGGKIYACGGYNGAGIGGGQYVPARDITITGGEVNAHGAYGAAIGGGRWCHGQNITVTDAKLTLTTGYNQYASNAAVMGYGDLVYSGKVYSTVLRYIGDFVRNPLPEDYKSIKIGSYHGKLIKLKVEAQAINRNDEFTFFWNLYDILIPNENGRIDVQLLTLPYVKNYGWAINAMELELIDDPCDGKHDFGWVDRQSCHVWACRNMKCQARDPVAPESARNGKHASSGWNTETHQLVCDVCGHIMETDTKAPVLEVLKDGGIYTAEDVRDEKTLEGKPGAYTFTVNDPAASGEASSGIKSVTINGVEQTVGSPYSLPAPDGGNNDEGLVYEVVATDNAGNSTTTTIRLYRRHRVLILSDRNDPSSAILHLGVPHGSELELPFDHLPKEAYFVDWDNEDIKISRGENNYYNLGIINSNRTFLQVIPETELPTLELGLRSRRFWGYHADSESDFCYADMPSKTEEGYLMDIRVTSNKIGYYFGSPVRYTQEQLKALDAEDKIKWTQFDTTSLLTFDVISYEEYNGSWYYYAKATNEVGTRYVSTPNIIIDADPAVALEYPSGKELTGKYGQTESGTYWGDLQFTVVDESEFTVKDGSTPLEPDENGVYTIKADMDEGIKHEIVIMDAGNNRTAYINEIRMNTLDRRDNPSALNLPNGANLEESLPKTVRILTARDSSMFTNIPVIWEIPETYEQASKREQSFTVNGTLDLSGTDIVLHPDKTELGKAQISVTIAGAPRYTLTIADSANGSITVVNATETAGDGTPLFYEGDWVMLSVVPNQGCLLKSLTVVQDGGESVACGGEDETYSFTQPGADVTVSAEFEAIQAAERPNVRVEGVYVYDGSEQTADVRGVDASMNITGDTGTNAGDYTVVVTSRTGQWADGSTDAVTAAWRIERAGQSAPAGLRSIAPSAEGESDGKITGVDTRMEYRAEQERTYTACTGSEIGDLTAGNYFVRYAEDRNHFVSPDAEVSVGAGASLSDCTITFDAGSGSGSMEPVTVREGGNYILPVCGFTAPANQEFKAWEIGGSEYNVGDPYIVNGNTTVTALWKDSVITPEFTIIFDGNGGTPAAHSLRTSGLKLAALPDAFLGGDYSFGGWYTERDGGDRITTETVFWADTTVYAHWVYTGGGGGAYDSRCTIRASAGANGSITPGGNVSVRTGSDQTFLITPDEGYAVSDVRIDGRSIGAVMRYTFENVRSAHTIEASFTAASTFADVPAGSYYERAVIWAAANGITNGVGNGQFGVDAPCTRAQAVTFLWRAAGSPAPEISAMPFTDVPVGSYYYDAVLWAVENGIAKGTSETTFGPDASCTRAQIVTFLYRAFGTPAGGDAAFADTTPNAYYAEAVRWAVATGVTTGTSNTTFSPNADCTRAQIVTFLWRCKK